MGRAQLAGVVRVPLVSARPPAVDALLLPDGFGRPLLQLNSHFLAPEHLDRVVERLGLPVSQALYTLIAFASFCTGLVILIIGWTALA